MNSKIYKQMDSRWSSKPYPRKGSSFGGNGCGCCACTHIAIEQDAKKNWTPENLRPWMIKQGFAVYGQGTTWSGITATLKHIGHKNVVCVWNDPMSVAWKELNKGNRIGIILFGSGTGPNGTRWTAGGHYVAFTDYKVKDGKHYFYCKDSGGRNHDGWYTYENSMKGCVAKVWIVERINKVPTPSPAPAPKKTTPKCIDISEHQGKINWKKVKASGINHVIIRAGYGKNNIDKYWKANIEGAIKAGIQNIGVYWFSYAYTNIMARNEARYLCNACAPYKTKINMPLFFDYEYDSARYAKEHGVKVTKSHVTELHKIFCAEVKRQGYKVGYYYNYDYKRNYIDIPSLPYYEWYALYDTSDKQTNTFAQQYSSKGKVDGISGNVDMNWIFGAEPKTKPSPAPAPSKLVVDGKMGTQTNKAVQKWVGTTQDGVIGPKTIKALQKKLGVAQDGKWGPNTTKALQKFLNKNGYTLATDGTLGVATIKALQGYLNKNVLK